MSQSHKLLIEPAPKPRVLILGNSPLSPSLSLELLKKECDVTVSSQLPPPLHLFDYIFQFSEFETVEKVVKKYLKSRAKLLLIETTSEVLPPLFESSQVRFLRLGDLGLWEEKEAISLMLKIMFRRGKSPKWDYTRGISQEIPQESPQEIPQEKVTIISDTTSVEISTHEENAEIPQDFSYKENLDKKKEEASPRTNIVEETHTSVFSIFSKILLGIFIIFVVLSGIFYFLFKDLETSIKKLNSDQKALKWGLVSEDIGTVLHKLTRAHTAYEIVSTPLFPFKDSKTFTDIETVFTEGENLLKGSNQTLSVLKHMEDKSSSMPAVFLSPTFPLDTALTEVKKFKVTVSSSEKKIEKVTLPLFPRETLLSYISGVSYSLDAVESLLPLASEYSKKGGKKTYLVLFQNNLELRPTGGFIGSYGLLTLDDGHMSDFKISDVYQADGQLKGHVEPPKAIRDYLNQPNWFLRDSNWDPDFAVSADRASWFLEKETGEKVDGVIGVNLFLIESLLKVTGPLKLADFGGQEINSDNFIQMAAQNHDNSFFPGSTAKQDFLTSAANTLFAQVSQKNNISWVSMINLLYQGFEEKQILVFDKDASLEKLFSDRGWAGRISAVVCSDGIAASLSSEDKSSCVPDYLGIVEANLGLNKVNGFITKTVTITKNLNKENKLSSSVILSYSNKSSGNGDQKSTYVNYLRILLPRSTIVNRMSINGVTIDNKQITSESYGSDKLSIGYLLRLASANKAVIKLEYSTALSLPENVGSYQFLFQKQSGDVLSPLIFSFTYPDSMHSLKPINFFNASGIEKEVYYTTDTSVDRVFALEIK